MGLVPRVQVILAAVCFGTTGTAQALGPDTTTPLTVGSARIAVGAVLLLLVARGSRRRGHGSRAVLLGMGLAVATYQVAFFSAVDRTGVGVGTVVALGSAPALAGLLAAVVAGERVGARWAQATALAVLGVAILVLAGSPATVDALGVGLALAAGAAYAVYTVAGKRLIDAGETPERVMASGFSIAALLLSPLLLTGEGGWLLTPGGVALALFLGAVPTALAYVLFAKGLRALPSAEAATLTLAEPLTAILLAVTLLGERPDAVAAVGAVLVLTGLLVLSWPDRRTGDATQDPSPSPDSATG